MSASKKKEKKEVIEKEEEEDDDVNEEEEEEEEEDEEEEEEEEEEKVVEKKNTKKKGDTKKEEKNDSKNKEKKVSKKEEKNDSKKKKEKKAQEEESSVLKTLLCFLVLLFVAVGVLVLLWIYQVPAIDRVVLAAVQPAFFDAYVNKTPMVKYKTQLKPYLFSFAQRGSICGAPEKSLTLTNFQAYLVSSIPGSIRYSVYIAGVGWSNYSADGEKAGDGVHGIEGLKMGLSGEIAKHYDVIYRGRNQGDTNTDWVYEGVAIGDYGEGHPLEVIRINITDKNRDAPWAWAAQKGERVDLLHGTIDIQNINNLESIEKVQRKESDDFWVVTYYRDIDRDSRLFNDAFNELSTTLKGTPNLRFGRVDCPDAGPVCAANKITDLPTIRVYYKGHSADYTGKRDVSSVKKWITKAMEKDGQLVRNPPPPPKPLEKGDAVAQLDVTSFPNAQAAAQNFWVVAFYRDNCEKSRKLVPKFNDLAGSMKSKAQLKFGRVNCKDSKYLCHWQDAFGTPTFRLYYKGASIRYKGSHDIDYIEEWLDGFIDDDGTKFRQEVEEQSGTKKVKKDDKEGKDL